MSKHYLFVSKVIKLKCIERIFRYGRPSTCLAKNNSCVIDGKINYLKMTYKVSDKKIVQITFFQLILVDIA